MKLIREIEKSFPKIKSFFDENSLIEFKNYDYKNLYHYHFGLGIQIRNKLLSEGDLLNLFLRSGIEDKDTMSMLMIQLYYLDLQIEGSEVR